MIFMEEEVMQLLKMIFMEEEVFKINLTSLEINLNLFNNIIRNKDLRYLLKMIYYRQLNKFKIKSNHNYKIACLEVRICLIANYLNHNNMGKL